MLFAQPFDCNGDFILTIFNNGSSIFYRIEIDPLTNDVLFNPLSPGNAGLTMNAIGYRSTDNYVYGIRGTDLCQVDRFGKAKVVANLSGLNPFYGYYAGDIPRDGKHLYILGSTGPGTNFSLQIAKIDLDDYSVETYSIPKAEEIKVFITDISFEPDEGLVYGFDRNENRLIKFDIETGIIDESIFPPSDAVTAMGAIFFDAFGNLYGYGEKPGSNISDTFYKIDKLTGEFEAQATGPVAIGKDACACPFTVEIQKEVSPKFALPCDELIYTFTIANASLLNLENVNFTDNMPEELIITEILNNPFGGDIISGVGSNFLSIENLSIPPGIDNIIVKAEIYNAEDGIYKNQAVLSNLPTELGGETFSDDPSTLTIGDSTFFEVISLNINPENGSASICNGEVITLETTEYANAAYLWNDGSTDNELDVNEEGWYYVEVDNGCQQFIDSIFVSENDLEVILGEDLEIELGDSIQIISSYTEGASLQWEDPLANSLSCFTCGDPFAMPFFDVEYLLTATNEGGCIDTADIVIKVLKDRKIYIPNAFSPNADGINDLFYIQGKGFGKINNLSIYDRWGQQVFFTDSGQINDTSIAWDGMHKGKKLDPAVFVYYAEIEFLDGVQMLYKGDLSLIK